jgi:phage tail protein X
MSLFLPGLEGIDRAQPYDIYELAHLPAVVCYYLPSQFAAVSWTLSQANTLAARAKYTLPIYVVSLLLSPGDGTKAATAAMALFRGGFPNHGVVAIDIEDDASSAASNAISALDIQEQIAREFIAEIIDGDPGLVPIVYGSVDLAERLGLSGNPWIADWLEDSEHVTDIYPTSDGEIGWQYAGNVVQPNFSSVVDLDLFSPYLFSRPEHLLGENVEKYTTKQGDTLRDIVQKLYGNEGNVTTVYGLNLRTLRAYGNNELPPGLTLVVPDVPKSVQNNVTIGEDTALAQTATDNSATVSEDLPTESVPTVSEPVTGPISEPLTGTETKAFDESSIPKELLPLLDKPLTALTARELLQLGEYL